MSAEEAARILARLTREQQELRERAEALERDLRQRIDGAGSGDGTADGMSETAQARRALSQLQTEVRAAELSAELQAAEAMRRRLEAGGQSGGGGEEDDESRDGAEGNAEGRRGAGGSEDLRAARRDAGGEEQGEGGASPIGAAARALLRQLEASPGLEAALRATRPGAVESLERWAEHRFSGNVPGTEAFKQDYADWDVLRAGLRAALEAIAADRAGALQTRPARGAA